MARDQTVKGRPAGRLLPILSQSEVAMSEENGNGSFKPIQIDVTDDRAFRTGVVQYLQMISDQTAVIPSLKKKVEKHDRIVQFGKWTAVPAVALLHGVVDHYFHKIFGGLK